MTAVLNILHRFAWVPWALLLLSTIAGIGGYFVTPTPPLEFISAKASPVVVEPGGVVTVAYHSVRNRTCKASVAIGWVDSLGSVVVRFPPITGGLGRVGDNFNAHEVRAPMLPGHYCLRLAGHHECANGDFDVTAPEVCVQVRE